MTQLVFIPGAGAGACAEAYTYQVRHFPGSVALTLPGHPEGTPCPDVKSCTEWVRGWLWAQGMNKDLVLVGYTLGASIALQYALDYPEEVKGVVGMTVAVRPKTRPAGTYELHVRAAEDPKAYEEWLAARRRSMMLIEPGLRDRLLESHRRMGPMSQLHDTKMIDAFDVHERIAGLKPRLLLLRGLNDQSNPPEYEKEIHEALPSSKFIQLSGAGHFPTLEKPAEVNKLIEEFMAGL